MDFLQYKLTFTEVARNNGYSEDNINKCLFYAEKLFQNGFPVIYNTTHLSALVGYKKEYIKGAVQFTNSYYREFKILKRNNQYRTIYEPLPSLKDIQLWILNNILYKAEISEYAKAYVKNNSLKQALVFHKKQKYVLKLDLKNFFGSIELDSIEDIFRAFGYSPLLSNLLAKLCSKDKFLPQGASTSPCLSNIFFKDCDSQIGAYCLENNIRYTRYSDDLTFSGEFESSALINKVEEIINQKSLSLNTEKTIIMHRGMRQSVLGAVVNDKIQTSFNYRNKIRMEMYYIKRYGFSDHKNRIGIDRNNYLDHLLGKVNYQLYLNSEDQEFIRYKKYLIELKEAGILE